MTPVRFDIITSFPDFKARGFCMDAYNRKFRESNIIINAKASQVQYGEHWGGLSIKTAFNGTEFYRVNNGQFAVNDTSYFVLNEGNYYSSYIDSKTEVESFTINFTKSMVSDATESLCRSGEFLLDNLNATELTREFSEKLHPHDDSVSPLILLLKKLSKNFSANKDKIEEVYLLLMEQLILKEKEVQKEINQVAAIKLSTKKELYKRLHRAKDHIDSCYHKDITIAELATVSFLNQAYFLRQFKNYFKVTPRQYLIRKRMDVAKKELEQKKDISITDICLQVGYNDLSSFSKLFKQYFQHSPEKYQRMFEETV